MNAEEFFKYLKCNICAQFPDAAATAGCWVIIKCDGGPGRLCNDMLIWLREHGFLLVPSVRNTTHITQECDLSFGRFKSIYRSNLQALVNERYVPGTPLSLSKIDFAILLNGREADEELGLVELPSAFNISFSRRRNLRSWEKAGAIPLTRAALKNKAVRSETTGENQSQVETFYDDATSDAMVSLIQVDAVENCLENLEARNHACVAMLNINGWNGDALKRDAPRKNNTKCRSVAQTMSNEDKVKNLSKGEKTHGTIYHYTGGEHLTSDIFFQSLELEERRRKKAEDKRITNENKKLFQCQETAREIEAKGKDDDKLNGDELTILLKWKLQCKGISKFKTKAEKLQEWINVKGNDVPELEDPANDSSSGESDSEEVIPTLEETMFARRLQADKVSAKSLLSGDHTSVEEIEELLRRKRARLV